MLPLLRSAREFRREIATRLSVPTVSIFGYGIKTLTDFSLRREANGRLRILRSHQEPKGDSAILESSANLEGSEIHPVPQYHGSLFVDNDVRMRLKIELTRSCA